MALAKRVKNGGSYYKGYPLSVASATGAYTLAIIPTTNNFAMNGLAVTPMVYGTGDSFDIYHMATTASTGGVIVKTLANSVPNIGGGVSTMLDFASLELVNPGESVRFVYNNVATQAMSVYVTIETLR